MKYQDWISCAGSGLQMLTIPLLSNKCYMTKHSIRHFFSTFTELNIIGRSRASSSNFLKEWDFRSKVEWNTTLGKLLNRLKLDSMLLIILFHYCLISNSKKILQRPNLRTQAIIIAKIMYGRKLLK